MIRIKQALSLGLMLVCAGNASAWDRDVTRVHVTAGITATASFYDYSSQGRLANAARIFGVGASIRVQRLIAATIDLDHTLYGSALAPMAWAPEELPSAEASSMTTALLGLELRAPTPDGRGPYLSAALGAGHLSLGAIQVVDMNGAARSYPGSHETGPAFALGAGIRTPRVLGGPSFQLGMRSVNMLSGNRWLGIIPLTAAVIF